MRPGLALVIVVGFMGLLAAMLYEKQMDQQYEERMIKAGFCRAAGFGNRWERCR